MRKKRKKGQVLFFPSGEPVPLDLQKYLIDYELIEIALPPRSPLWDDIGGLDPPSDDGRAA